MSQKAKDLISVLLNEDSEARLTAEQALRHPWLQVAKGEKAGDAAGLDSSVVRGIYSVWEDWHSKPKAQENMYFVVLHVAT